MPDRLPRSDRLKIDLSRQEYPVSRYETDHSVQEFKYHDRTQVEAKTNLVDMLVGYNKSYFFIFSSFL